LEETKANVQDTGANNPHQRVPDVNDSENHRAASPGLERISNNHPRLY